MEVYVEYILCALYLIFCEGGNIGSKDLRKSLEPQGGASRKFGYNMIYFDFFETWNLEPLEPNKTPQRMATQQAWIGPSLLPGRCGGAKDETGRLLWEEEGWGDLESAPLSKGG